MPESRRSSARDRSGARQPSRQPSRPGRPQRGGRPAARDTRPARGNGRSTASGARSGSDAQHRLRPTGRAAVLVLVAALLIVSSASSLRAYRQQRHQIEGLQSQIAERRAQIADLTSEKEQFKDPAYVRQRARELGYVNPGETPYSVRKDGAPLAAGSTLGDPSTIDPTRPTAWWSTEWDSMEVAGHPPTQAAAVPPTLIVGSEN